MSPPGSDEYSWISNELTSDGQLYQPMMMTVGSSMNTPPRMSIHACARGESLPLITSMRTCSLRFSAYAGDQQEHRRVEIPLQFEPRVGADVERVARHGVAGADDHGGEPEPGD